MSDESSGPQLPFGFVPLMYSHASIYRQHNSRQIRTFIAKIRSIGHINEQSDLHNTDKLLNLLCQPFWICNLSKMRINNKVSIVGDDRSSLCFPTHSQLRVLCAK